MHAVESIVLLNVYNPEIKIKSIVCYTNGKIFISWGCCLKSAKGTFLRWMNEFEQK